MRISGYYYCYDHDDISLSADSARRGEPQYVNRKTGDVLYPNMPRERSFIVVNGHVDERLFRTRWKGEAKSEVRFVARVLSTCIDEYSGECVSKLKISRAVTANSGYLNVLRTNYWITGTDVLCGDIVWVELSESGPGPYSYRELEIPFERWNHFNRYEANVNQRYNRPCLKASLGAPNLNSCAWAPTCYRVLRDEYERIIADSVAMSGVNESELLSSNDMDLSVAHNKRIAHKLKIAYIRGQLHELELMNDVLMRAGVAPDISLDEAFDELDDFGDFDVDDFLSDFDD